MPYESQNKINKINKKVIKMQKRTRNKKQSVRLTSDWDKFYLVPYSALICSWLASSVGLTRRRMFRWSEKHSRNLLPVKRRKPSLLHNIKQLFVMYLTRLNIIQTTQSCFSWLEAIIILIIRFIIFLLTYKMRPKRLHRQVLNKIMMVQDQLQHTYIQWV